MSNFVAKAPSIGTFKFCFKFAAISYEDFIVLNFVYYCSSYFVSNKIDDFFLRLYSKSLIF